MRSNDELLTLRFASLLHDIGKFWQGTGEKGNHQELSARFIRTYLPELEKSAFLAGHHDPSQYKAKGYKLLKILVCADWLSSGERLPTEEKEKRIETPLLSIFSNIKIDGKKSREDKYIVPSIYSLDAIVYPKGREEISEDLSSSYKVLWESFCEEIGKVNKDNLNAFFTSLYYLLQKYTSFIPSAVYKSIPDVSLFDHLKTTCAIAECLYKSRASENDIDDLIRAIEKSWREEELNEKEKGALNENRFILIGGDISGVQKFIYSIISKKAAKALKGRSFYLELLGETIAQYILKKLDLPTTNLLYCAGGHFYILSPKVDLEEIRKDVSEKILEIHKGKVYIAIDSVDISAKDFRIGNFSIKWREIGEKLGQRKKKKFEEIIEKGAIFEVKEVAHVCQVCGLPIENEAEMRVEEEIIKCTLCKSFENLANEIRNKYLIEIKTNKIEDGWNKPFSYFGYKHQFCRDIPEEIDIERVYKINDTNFVMNIPYSQGVKFYLITPPKEFEKLAEIAEGLKRWAVVRGDVDNLGRIFSEGLGENATVSRISTLSSMLSFFFKGWINNICKNFEDKIYGIYSGGDDFFIVGSWDILPDLSIRIYTEFRKFTCENPCITLSVGISIPPSQKYPLYRVADTAGEELEKAKGVDGKDAIAFLGKAVKWEKFMELEKFKEELKELVEDGISRGFLQKLYGIYQIYSEKAKNVGDVMAQYDGRYRRWSWLLAYVLAREKLEKEKKGEIRKDIKNNIKFLDIGVRWVEYLTRKEVGE